MARPAGFQPVAALDPPEDAPHLLARLRALLTSLPSGALLPVDWLVDQLGSSTASAPEMSTAPEVDLTVADLARLFSKRPSTMRGWIERGDFSGAYKLGKEWRIPASSVAAFQDRHRAGVHGPAFVRARPRLSDWRRALSRSRVTTGTPVSGDGS